MVVAVLAAGCAAPRSSQPTASDETDVWFMQHLAGHLLHQTAILDLAGERITRPTLARLAGTINHQGQGHLTQIQEWLANRGLAPNDPQQDPISRKESDLARLSRVHGARFDLAFLKVMTARHRAGSKLAATELRDGTLPEVRQLAQQLLAIQKTQIGTMTAWKRAWSKADGNHATARAAGPSGDGRRERSCGYPLPREETAAKHSAHFSMKQAASQSSFSTSRASALMPQTLAPVTAHTAWGGPTGAVLATRNTPSGRWARDGTCWSCSAPIL
jgi:uncharacterized protein (DUF305 family)